MMASLSSIGEFPNLVRDVFVTDTTNSANAIIVKFYIRGKPWLVSIDHNMLFKYHGNPQLVFSKITMDGNAMWGAIIEKAWAKVRGNYINADGGLTENALLHLVGIPVFRYSTADITT